MAFSLRRQGPSKFEQAADGSMTLIEHVRELRNRLFWAALGILVGLIVGFILSKPAFDLLSVPYCKLDGAVVDGKCRFIVLGAADTLILRLKVALWIGLIIGAPMWLYQLWAFIAPGLHRHERKWAYLFVAVASPLFTGGALLAYFILDKSLYFLQEAGITGITSQLEITAYISFVTNMMLLFGVGFLFPLVLLMLNLTGVVSARRLLSWWRVVVFAAFAFAAVVTPDPSPFGMTLLAAALSLLYFIAVGIAFLNDKRKGRGKEIYAGLDDDAISPIDDAPEPVAAGDRIEVPTPVAVPKPLESRYDDMT
jgi:sec-independent protein translocase protein TatC